MKEIDNAIFALVCTLLRRPPPIDVDQHLAVRKERRLIEQSIASLGMQHCRTEQVGSSLSPTTRMKKENQ